MAIRKIVKIDEEKCNGCGLCVPSCAEGAIQIIDGKARLVKDSYCDGLGACLGECPQDAISIIEREADEFDEEAALAHANNQPEDTNSETHKSAQESGGCPGSMARSLGVASSGGCPGQAAKMLMDKKSPQQENVATGPAQSQLATWPVQLKLVAPNAPYLEDCDLMVVADCVPFAMADFHQKLLKGNPVVVGCPKLDEGELYVSKLAAILRENNINSLTVVHMEVPCCSGIVRIVDAALAEATASVTVRDVTVSLDGKLKEEKTSYAV